MIPRQSRFFKAWIAWTAALVSAPALFSGLWAQEVEISAHVNKSVVSLNETIDLRVTVSGSAMNLPEPQLPSTPNFSVYSSGTSQNVSIINGRISGSVSYSYSLAPRFVGKTTIGPIRISFQGKEIKTDPIEVQVVRPSQSGGGVALPQSAAPPPSRPRGGRREPEGNEPGRGQPPVFVSASLDKHKSYVNEQATLSVRFYTSVSLLGNPEYIPPGTQGFLADDLPPERHGEVTIRGRVYNYSEIKTALFPVQGGPLHVGQATIRCQVQEDMTVDPYAPDFFQKFFSQGRLQGQTRELKTDPLTLIADPLPLARRPDSFTGAVGRFRVSADVDKAKAKVGDAVNLNITVEGSGNLKALSAPKLPDLSSFRAYDTVSTLNLNKANDLVQGSKIFKTILVPRVSGILKIPPIPFSYFDPAKEDYVQTATNPIEIQVSPAPEGQSAAVGYISSNGSTPQDISAINEDIRYVREPMESSAITKGLTALAAGDWIHLIPLAGFLALAASALIRMLQNQDPVKVRSRQALSKAAAKLRRAESHLQTNPVLSGSLLAEALTGFLADKLNVSSSSLSLRQAEEALRSRYPNLQNGRLHAMKNLWEELEQLRFAGKEASSPAALTSLFDQVQKWIKDFDRSAK